MAYPPLPVATQPCYRWQVFGVLYGQTTINTFYFMDMTPGAAPRTTGELEFMNSTLWTDLDGPFLACLADQWSGEKIVLESLDNRTQRPAILNFTPGAQVGTRTGEADTPWVAAKLNRITAVRGLRGQGCIRLSGIPLEDVEGSYISAGLKTALNALGDALMLPFTSLADPTFTINSALVYPGRTTPIVNRGLPTAEWEASTILASQKTRRTRVVG